MVISFLGKDRSRSKGIYLSFMGSTIKQKIQLFLFGEIASEEAKKFSLLSLTFFFIIGSYWLMRALKNALIKDTVGVCGIPMAKKFSVVAMICLLLVYTKLLGKVTKHRLFYIICVFYSMCFFGIAYGTAFPSMVNPNWFGFASYSLIESFGSLTVALFWAFVATTVTISTAKRGYAIIFASGQFGALLGTTLVTRAEFFGIPFLCCVSACAALVVPFLIKKFILLVKQNSTNEDKCINNPECSKAGLFEGFKLLVTKPYVLGIFLIASLYEIVVTIFDYQMQLLADKYYSTAAYASFNAFYGQLVTIVACLFAFLGTRFFIKRLGFRLCLMIFPLIVAALICHFYITPSLWVALGSMVTIKALSYGFNNPVKEIIYIPTSDAIKFKAKGWIEMFGNRSSKAGGSTINGVLSKLPQGFVEYGLIISLGVISIWVIVALLMGNAFTRLIKDKKIVT